MGWAASVAHVGMQARVARPSFLQGSLESMLGGNNLSAIRSQRILSEKPLKPAKEQAQ
jgi:hypothetical protein